MNNQILLMFLQSGFFNMHTSWVKPIADKYHKMPSCYFAKTPSKKISDLLHKRMNKTHDVAQNIEELQDLGVEFDNIDIYFTQINEIKSRNTIIELHIILCEIMEISDNCLNISVVS